MEILFSKEDSENLSKSLKSIDTLTQLDLSNNNIGDAVAKEIANALLRNTSLTRLDLMLSNMAGIGKILDLNLSTQ